MYKHTYADTNAHLHTHTADVMCSFFITSGAIHLSVPADSPVIDTVFCTFPTNQIKSNQLSNQIKSNLIKSNQIKSNQIKSNQIKSNQIKIGTHNMISILVALGRN